jgi:hypothetical protein
MTRSRLAAAAAALVLVPTAAFGWGSSGHRIIGEAAMRALPADLPGFLHTPQAALDVGEFSREPDRIKGAGKTFDSDLDPGHFLDLNDDGKVLAGPALAGLPVTRAEYEAQLKAAGTDSWKAGFLPYSILENYQVVARDLAMWRVLSAAAANPAWAAHKAWFTAELKRREALTLRDIGTLSHFVGDGSQPLHVTVHFNGWGDYPNPEGYTAQRIHSPFESDLVREAVKPEAVAAQMTPAHLCNCAIDQRMRGYLTATGTQVIPLYQLDKAGGLMKGDPRGAAFATKQLAVGASELRDMIAEAWAASLNDKVGWRPVPVQDVLSGKTDPYPALYGID